MKLGVVLSTKDPETAFNAMRLANFSANEGDDVAVFELPVMDRPVRRRPRQARALSQSKGREEVGGVRQGVGRSSKGVQSSH